MAFSSEKSYLCEKIKEKTTKERKKIFYNAYDNFRNYPSNTKSFAEFIFC